MKKELSNSKNKKSLAPPIDFFAQTEAPLLITNTDCSLIFANESLALLFGLKTEEINYHFLTHAKIFDSENRQLNINQLPFVVAAKEKKSVTDFKLRFEKKDLTGKWFGVNSFLIEEPRSDSIFVLSLFRDVTKEAEREQSFKETIANIPTVLYSTNSDGSRYNFITDAVRTLFGFSPEEIYENRTHILRSICPGHFKEFKKFITELRKGEEAIVEYRMKDRFGKEHWVRHSGIPVIKNNTVARIVGIIQEITEEKKIQLRLERSEERFRMLIDTADDLIFILDGFGYFSMVNKNGAGALGYTPGEMTGRHFLEFIDKDDEPKIAEAFTKVLNSNGITNFEAVFLDRFDKGVTFEVSAKPMITNGEVSGMLSIGRNITSRKLDEQKIKDLNSKLVEANRIISIERERARHKITVLEELNKLKSEFVSNVSHELRTPLASIVGFAETILSDPELPKETVHEFSNIILMEGKRLAKLINDVLDFSRLETGEDELQKVSMSIIGVLEEVLKSFDERIEEKNLTVSKEFPKEDLIIKADRERISKVFWNLISNAIRFTNSGGRISLIAIDLGKEVEVAVSDTGIGISENDLPNLFQKFSKVQKAGAQIIGAGFGLVSTKQIIDLHKGFIKVRSQVNKGTTFIIRLPK